MESLKNPVGLRDNEDKELLQTPAATGTLEQADFIAEDPWRVLRIQGEIVEGFDALSIFRRQSPFWLRAVGPGTPTMKPAGRHQGSW